MYHMKNIISHDSEISLPKCMFFVRNPNESLQSNDIDTKITDQVIKHIKVPNKDMTELEHRQDELLKKLDVLYERIKTISSICAPSGVNVGIKAKKPSILTLEEIVLNINPDSLPWYLLLFLKDSSLMANISWHVHSSVTNEKVQKIQAFVNNLKITNSDSKINLRLIFKTGEFYVQTTSLYYLIQVQPFAIEIKFSLLRKLTDCVSTNSELKISSLAVPIVGTVNILRYLSLVYPNTLPYDFEDYYVDGLLDLCYLLEKTPEKNKDAIIQKLFAQCKDWIYRNQFSIIDIAVFNVVKQSRSKPKSVPKDWFERCEKLCT